MKKFKGIDIRIKTHPRSEQKYQEKEKQSGADRIRHLKGQFNLKFLWQGNPMNDFLKCSHGTNPTAEQFVTENRQNDYRYEKGQKNHRYGSAGL